MPDRTDTFYAVDGAIQGYGAQMQVGDGTSPENFESIAGVTQITPGAMETEDIDRTHLRSPDRHREHAPGLRDSGAFSCGGRWLPTEQSQSNAGGGSGAFASGGLIKLWRDAALHNFRILLNDGSPATAWPFRGYVSQFQPGVIEGPSLIDFNFSIQPTEAYDASLP